MKKELSAIGLLVWIKKLSSSADGGAASYKPLINMGLAYQKRRRKGSTN